MSFTKIDILHKLNISQLIIVVSIAVLSLTALLLTRLANAVPALSDAPSFVSNWVNKDIDGNDLCPYYMAVDSTDNIYMSSFCSAYVFKFDTNGESKV